MAGYRRLTVAEVHRDRFYPACAFLDVLLGGATLVVEVDDPVRFHRHVGDNEADPREQLAGMPLDLGDNTTGFVPGRCLILEVAVDPLHAFWWTTQRALEQMRNLALKYAIGPEADGVEISLRFQSFV